eukprot:CAMPEP_0203977928 /NCGR_PEP_ID=MMETSP0359-20131031/101860_1 /ASSEMBLY_ACC=CAM_ASM_000338 /TAXON_ID=268821 /ORGANISM="Scrippsiella Hangoei, Strain SHTV-5" /LENGTH=113 /DNA_ID=CAMNT_0050916137 /DNA_START=31 /DNA_END=372 /DNA_ORIENTATION=+
MAKYETSLCRTFEDVSSNRYYAVRSQVHSQLSLRGDPEQTQDRASDLVEGIRRVHGPLVVAIVKEDLLPLVGVRDLANVHAEEERRGTHQCEGGPHPSVDVRHKVLTTHGACE